MAEAVIARRARRAPSTVEERLGREKLDGDEYAYTLRSYLIGVQERCGWAAHALGTTATAHTLTSAAVARAFDEAGVNERPLALMNRCVEAVFDGYELACALTARGGDGTGRALKSAAAVTAFAKRAAKAGPAVDAGPLAEVVAALLPGWLAPVPPALHAVARLAMRTSFAAGALLHHVETEADHPLLDGLRAATVKPRAAPEPEAKQAPPNPALLDAILAAPNDDGPRLVYADWLIEEGDPRGELIQIQCTLGRTLVGAGAKHGTRVAPAALGGLSADELKEREARLIKRHERTWRAEFPSLRQWQWRRGFVDGGVADIAAFVAALPVLARTPLERVQLTGLKAADVERLRAAPAHPTLRAVELSQNRLSAKSVAILHAPLFSTVRWLDLWGNDLSRADTARALAAAPLPALTRLGLNYTDLTDEALVALGGADWFPRLTLLSLATNEALSGEGVAAIARATSLESLELWTFGRRASGIEPLFEALLAHAPESLRSVWAPLEDLPPRLRVAVTKRFAIDEKLRRGVLAPE